jgi:Transglycosylase SLT domain
VKLTLGCSVLLVLAPIVAHAADVAVLDNGFEIRHERREVVGTDTRLYLEANPSSGYVDVPTSQIVRYEHDDSIRPKAAPSRATAGPKPSDISSAVEDASKAHAIDPDLISSVIHAESRFNPRAVSPKGAQGLMQLMPGTAAQLGVSDAFDPNSNVNGGTRYLRELLLRYNDDMAKALAAYNAGPRRVDQYRGVPPYRETRRYVADIITEFNKKKLASQKRAASRGTETSKKVAPKPRNSSARRAKTTSKSLVQSSANGSGQ